MNQQEVEFPWAERSIPQEPIARSQQYISQNKFTQVSNPLRREHLRTKAISCQYNIIEMKREPSSIQVEEEIIKECVVVAPSAAAPMSQKIQEYSSYSEYVKIQSSQPVISSKDQSNEEVYSGRIISSMKQSQSMPVKYLSAHTITADNRAKMIDWMIEVTTSYGCSDQTFFLAVQYMDSYFAKSPVSLSPSDLHLTGVASMLIACKYQEVYPLRLQTFYEKIGHKKLSIADIKRREAEILQAIDYDLSSSSLLDFIQVSVKKLQLSQHLSSQHLQFFEKMCVYLAKMVCHEYSLLSSHDLSTIGGSVIYVSFKILQQMYSQFDLVGLVQCLMKVLDLNHESILAASTALLNLARSFDSIYSTLHNLRKHSQDIHQISKK